MSKKSFTAAFKSKVAIEAIKGHQTISGLATEFEVHPAQINNWQKQLLESSTQRGLQRQGVISCMPR